MNVKGIMGSKTFFLDRLFSQHGGRWIVDNGNAMQVNDSHRLVINQQNGRIESIAGVKRWDELLETISTQAWVSSYLNMPMRFAVSFHLHLFLKSLIVQ